MVSIASGITKDLDKYLTNRKKESSSFFSRPKPKPAPKEEKPSVPEGLRHDEVHVFEKEPKWWQRLFSGKKEEVSEDLTEDELARLEAMEVELEQIERAEVEHPEAVEQFEEERESLMDKFFSLFRGFERQHRMDEKAAKMEYIEDEVIPRMDEDVKRVLKIVHKWLGKLPKRARDEFRKSNDFLEYKKLLEKYGVAKKAAEAPEKPAKKGAQLKEAADGYAEIEVPEK